MTRPDVLLAVACLGGAGLCLFLLAWRLSLTPSAWTPPDRPLPRPPRHLDLKLPSLPPGQQERN